MYIVDSKLLFSDPKEKLQIPVSSTIKDANVSMTIFTSDGKVLKSDDVEDSVEIGALTNYPLNGYNWRCNDKDHLFYISVHFLHIRN